MTSSHPFGNNPEKIERYRDFWNRSPVDRPLVGFSFVGWYPLEYFSDGHIHFTMATTEGYRMVITADRMED